VIDASAVLALLNREPGEDRVGLLLADSVISAVNYSEGLGRLIGAGMPGEAARESVELLELEVVGFDAELAHLAARLRLTTKQLGLSLEDWSCLALGLARHHTVVTAKRMCGKLPFGVKIDVIR